MTAPLGLDDLSRAIAERLAGEVPRLPVLPEVALRVIELFNAEDPEPGTLVRLVSQDPVLAGHLLKAANSPILRAAARITNVQQAVARLGMRMVGVTALSACLGPQLFRAPAYTALIDRIWSESLAAGVWAREIARELRRDGEVAFAAGLLHRIGEPLVLQLVQESDGTASVARSAVDLRQLLDTHATLAGARVAAAWKLPEPIAEPIRHWRDFRQANAARDAVALVAIAHWLIALGEDGAAAPGPAQQAIAECAALRLDDQTLARLLERRPAVDALIEAMRIA